MRLLTKSRFMIGLQCPVWLWKSVHAPDELPEPDAEAQAKFTVGHEVGALAQQLYPDGVRMVTDGFKENLEQARQWLPRRRTLFEPGFLADGLYARPDILVPVGEDEWDLVEVKSGTSAKPQHVYDVAFQKHVCEKAGLKIRSTYLMRLDREYVRHGSLDVEALFAKDDITEQVEEFSLELPGLIERQQEILRLPAPPEIELVGQCSSYYGCPVHDELRASLPPGNVFELYKGKRKAADLYQAGIKELSLIPSSEKLNDKQSIQVEAARTDQPYVDNERLKEWLDSLEYPIHYLDFETLQFAIPQYEGTRPYQQVPFQWSLHVQREDGGVEHKEFLADGADDPRPEFTNALKEALEAEGSIVVYHQSFEQRRLEELAQARPDHEGWIRDAISRMRDLLVPFRNFWYHSLKQRGSCSLKATLPALTGKDYSGLQIQDGGAAQREFMRVTFEEGIPEEEKKKVREDLLEYCGLDTEAMVWMVDALRELL